MFNQVRNFTQAMSNPITRKVFFLHRFAPKRYVEFSDLMMTLNTQFHLGAITEAEMDSTLLSFWCYQRFFILKEVAIKVTHFEIATIV